MLWWKHSVYVSCGEVQHFSVEFDPVITLWGYQCTKSLCPLTWEKKHIVAYLHSDKAVKHLQFVFGCLYQVTLNTDFYLECSESFKKNCAVCRKLVYPGIFGVSSLSLISYKPLWDHLPSLTHQSCWQLMHLLNLQFLPFSFNGYSDWDWVIFLVMIHEA